MNEKVDQNAIQFTFFPSGSFSRNSVRGFTYSERLAMVFVSDEWIPEPVKSMALTL